MLNVYEQVTNNKTKSILVVAIFVAFISFSAYLITITFDLDNSFITTAIGFSFIGSFISYFYGDKIILSLNRARPAKRKEFFDFYTVTENLATGSQLPPPKIYVIDSPAPNAFATGRDPKNAIICATTGLLNKLNRTELEAVIAHELSHIKNYDIRLMMIVGILIGTLSILVRTTYISRSSSNRRNSASSLLAIIGLLLLILSPLIAKLIQLAISRRREYLADASAVKLTRQPLGLINALTKISQDPNILTTASPGTAHLFISNPLKKSKVNRLFSTHPPIKDRIAALNNML